MKICNLTEFVFPKLNGASWILVNFPNYFLRLNFSKLTRVVIDENETMVSSMLFIRKTPRAIFCHKTIQKEDVEPTRKDFFSTGES